VFAIFLFVYVLDLTVRALSFSTDISSLDLSYLVLPISYLLVALLLWFFPFTAVATLVRGFRLQDTPEKKFKESEIADTLFILLGLYLIFHVVSDAAYWGLIVQYNNSIDPNATLSVEEKASIGATVIEGILALALILKRKGIMTALRNLRK